MDRQRTPRRDEQDEKRTGGVEPMVGDVVAEHGLARPEGFDNAVQFTYRRRVNEPCIVTRVVTRSRRGYVDN